jgi:hypothetical protein
MSNFKILSTDEKINGFKSEYAVSGVFLYGKISNAKLLETTFVLRLLKILSAPSRASASNIEKMAEKFKSLEFFLDFFKCFGQRHIIAFSMRLIYAFQKKITFDKLHSKNSTEHVVKDVHF